MALRPLITKRKLTDGHTFDFHPALQHVPPIGLHRDQRRAAGVESFVSPNFSAWAHVNLVAMAEDLTASNAQLRQLNAQLVGDNLQLDEDLKTALAAWRNAILETAK
jgi:hypothetical protein